MTKGFKTDDRIKGAPNRDNQVVQDCLSSLCPEYNQKFAEYNRRYSGCIL